MMHNYYMYTQEWRVDQPGCLIVLLDQSAKMHERADLGSLGAGIVKADAVAALANDLLREMASYCVAGNTVRPYLEVAVFSYGPGAKVRNALGGSLVREQFVSVVDLYNNPLRVVEKPTQEYDPETGQMVETTILRPFWIDPQAENGAIQCAALDAAYYLASTWIAGHPGSFPPIILHVAGGESGDGDPQAQARKIRYLATRDGAALLFNYYLPGGDLPPLQFPHSIYQMAGDKQAMRFFGMSSLIPEPLLTWVNQLYGPGISLGTRGYAVNSSLPLAKLMPWRRSIRPRATNSE